MKFYEDKVGNLQSLDKGVFYEGGCDTSTLKSQSYE